MQAAAAGGVYIRIPNARGFSQGHELAQNVTVRHRQRKSHHREAVLHPKNRQARAVVVLCIKCTKYGLKILCQMLLNVTRCGCMLLLSVI